MTVTDSLARELLRFEKRLDLLRQSLDIPGMSVAVVHKQAVVFARGFGIADLANGTEATENTPYSIASLTKPFTAAVIMRLVETGRLDLDEALSVAEPSNDDLAARFGNGVSIRCDRKIARRRRVGPAGPGADAT